jgi:hypothetical protein
MLPANNHTEQDNVVDDVREAKRQKQLILDEDEDKAVITSSTEIHRQTMLETIRKGKEVKLQSKRDGTDILYQLHDWTIFSCPSEDANLLARERQFRDEMDALEKNCWKKILVKGCALQIVQNGFVCVYGDRDLLKEHVTKFEKEEGMDSELCVIPFQLLSTNKVEELKIRLCASLSLDVKNYNTDKEGRLRMVILAQQSGRIPETSYVLLLRSRSIGEGTKVDFGFPGGKRHLGESSVECARREYKEETGLHIESLDDSCSVIFDGTVKIFMVQMQ